MPIQFQCPHCAHSMQLPDAAAGKQGKCPKCQGVVTVPAAMAAAPVAAPNPQDEEFWSELGDDKKGQPVEEELSHGQPKQTAAQLLRKHVGNEEEEKQYKRTGLAWESSTEGPFDRYWDTAIVSLNNPGEAFATMRLTGGMGKPFWYTVFGAIFGGVLSTVYGLIGGAISIYSDYDPAEPIPPATLAMFFVSVGVLIFVSELLLRIVGPFVQAGIIHLFLQMFGVKPRGFDMTYRVAAYVQGSTAVCQILPVLGNLFAAIVWLIAMIGGQTTIQEQQPNKAGLAVFLAIFPLGALLAGFVGVTYVLAIALGLLSALAGGAG